MQGNAADDKHRQDRGYEDKDHGREENEESEQPFRPLPFRVGSGHGVSRLARPSGRELQNGLA
jgi:hypothetical protein